MEKKRIGSFDAVKALAIYLVIWGHCILHLAPWNTKKDFVFVFINSFHMPLFMIVAGYFSISALSLDFQTLIKKKSKELLLPALTWGSVAAIVSVVILERDLSFYGYINSFVFHGLWFLKSLFCCYLFAFFLTKGGRMFITIGFLLLLFFTLYKVNLMFPAFLTGWFIRKYNLLDNLTKPFPIISMILIFAALTYTYDPYFLNTPNDMLTIIQKNSFETWVMYFYKTMYRILVGCSGALFIILAFYKWGKKCSGAICRVGQKTLGIYVIQSVLLEQIAKYYYEYLGGGTFIRCSVRSIIIPYNNIPLLRSNIYY